MMTRPQLRFLLALLLAVLPMQRSAAFSSLYVFGDGVCTTTVAHASNLKSKYYENRYCNGRVWVEVLAQWQGLTFDSARNKSYFGQDSGELVTNISSFTAPPDVATALFVVWCNDADVLEFSQVNTPPYTTGDLAAWTSFINQAVARHTTAVTNLYNKGVRTLVMPKAVDVTAAPYYSLSSTDKAFMRQRVIEFNAALESALVSLMASKAGLRIHRPDTFSFFDQVLATPSAYGLVNTGIDAVTNLGSPSFTGPGASYIFWDYVHPTAKLQMHLAELSQRMISPVKVNGISHSGSTTQITIANIPLGRQGIVEGSANLQPPWAQDATFTQPFSAGGSTTAPISVPCTASCRFYRVSFPVVWTWP